MNALLLPMQFSLLLRGSEITRQARRVFPYVCVLVLVVGLLMMPDMAFASTGGTTTGTSGAFSVNTLLPSSLQTKSFLEQMVTIIIIVAIAGIFIILGFGTMGGVSDVFSSMSEARQRGDWGVLLKTLAMVIAVFIVAVTLAVLAYGWLSTINIKPTLTIG